MTDYIYNPITAACFGLMAVVTASLDYIPAWQRGLGVGLAVTWLLLYIVHERMSRALRDDLHSLMNDFERTRSAQE